ncbi:head-tail adaptor protein [Xanthobacter sp. TB0139]|uniref:head-tail adaptor protein n=1 Tax=Xanthobacter sp. TB0139 TaxID=3459178 RepID=UPI004039ACEF
MTSAGDLRGRVMFQARSIAPDGAGNHEAGWVNQFERRAYVRPRLGGEAVVAARLEGITTLTITVRACSATRQIQADWRAVDARTGAIYALTCAPVDPDGRRQWLEMMATTGRAP